jgi:hypothetical protein
MSHANTSPNFQALFSSYPCVTKKYCEVAQRACPYNNKLERCSKGLSLRKNTIKMCDSGIFQKEGCSFDYQELFSIYERMKVDYGIIIDYLKKKDETIRSASEALQQFRERAYSFRLVGVAQGTTLEEYVECYEELKKIGYSCIAIGGLLKKAPNSARYVHVGDHQLLRDTLLTIRSASPEDWLFALGCYHPERHEFFSKTGIWGADYKGWIFNYDIGKGRKSSSIETKGRKGLQRIRFNQTRKYLRKIYKLTRDNMNTSNVPQTEMPPQVISRPYLRTSV